MGLSNDERGWVMTCLSGIACVLGASIICVDVLIRQIPSKRDFRIQDSDVFLSSSLSLTFGVMLYSALVKMLPSSKSALVDGGFSPKQASWILIACFIGGVLGIQLLSRIMHSFMPTHAVDCHHSHGEDHGVEGGDDGELKGHSHGHGHGNGHAHVHVHGHEHEHEQQHTHLEPPRTQRSNQKAGNQTSRPNGRREASRQTLHGGYFPYNATYSSTVDGDANDLNDSKRPPLHERVTSTLATLTSGKQECDSSGPCHGFSDPCGNECFKNVNARGGFRAPTRKSSSMSSIRKGGLARATTAHTLPRNETTPLLEDIEEDIRPHTHHAGEAPTRYLSVNSDTAEGPSDSGSDTIDACTREEPNPNLAKTTSNEPEVHHHHVPSNAFLSIGLQTSIAIALHKLPEGFITYATNHANPRLGVSVFLALFIHNISEGFAMALPLYLAINSRAKAMAISFVLGGLSQPIGAAVAAIWFKIAGNGNWAPSEGVYGAMFAVTAGIMASVALQLFSESLDLTHNRTLCMFGAFAGMAILGISSALTA